MFAIGERVGLAEWIIDVTCLVVYYLDIKCIIDCELETGRAVDQLVLGKEGQEDICDPDLAQAASEIFREAVALINGTVLWSNIYIFTNRLQEDNVVETLYSLGRIFFVSKYDFLKPAKRLVNNQFW